jgi:hypothetical protein
MFDEYIGSLNKRGGVATEEAEADERCDRIPPPEPDKKHTFFVSIFGLIASFFN